MVKELTGCDTCPHTEQPVLNAPTSSKESLVRAHPPPTCSGSFPLMHAHSRFSILEALAHPLRPKLG